jgi:hypothetical protein
MATAKETRRVDPIRRRNSAAAVRMPSIVGPEGRVVCQHPDPHDAANTPCPTETPSLFESLIPCAAM